MMNRAIFLMGVLAVVGCGSGQGSDSSHAALVPPTQALAYIDSNGVALGDPVAVAELKEFAARMPAKVGVQYFQWDPRSQQFEMARKVAAELDGDPMSGGGGGAGTPVLGEAVA